MKKYNLFVLLPNLAEEQIKDLDQKIAELIEKVGGKVEEVNYYGKRKLSYAIKKTRHGFYIDYVLSLAVDQIEKLKSELKLKPEVLRFELSKHTETSSEARSGSASALSKPQSLAEKHKNLKTNEDKGEDDKKKEAGELQDKETEKEKPQISIEELDKKLDNILESSDI